MEASLYKYTYNLIGHRPSTQSPAPRRLGDRPNDLTCKSNLGVSRTEAGEIPSQLIKGHWLLLRVLSVVSQENGDQ